MSFLLSPVTLASSLSSTSPTITAVTALVALLAVVALWAVPILALWALGCLLEWLWPAPLSEKTGIVADGSDGSEGEHPALRVRHELQELQASRDASTAAACDTSSSFDWSNPNQWPSGPSDTVMTVFAANVASLATLPTLPAMPTLPRLKIAPKPKLPAPSSAPSPQPLLDRAMRHGIGGGIVMRGLPHERPSLPLYDDARPEPDWPPRPRVVGAKTYRYVFVLGELVRLRALGRFHALPPSRPTLN